MNGNPCVSSGTERRPRSRANTNSAVAEFVLHVGDYEDDDRSFYDGSSPVSWSRSDTAWAHLAFKFGYFTCAWYLLLGVYLRFIEPRVDLVGLACEEAADNIMTGHIELHMRESSAAETEGSPDADAREGSPAAAR